MSPPVEVFLFLSQIICCQSVTNSRSDDESCNCLSPFPGPDILYNIYACSVALDWSEFITSDCQSATAYEVQYVNECTRTGDVMSINQTTNSSGQSMKIFGKCSMVNIKNCFVRMRFKLNDSEPALWSRYSAWTTLSNNYEATQTCVLNGTDSCFNLTGDCSDGAGRPEFIINQKHYLFQDIYFNMSLPDFDVTYNPILTSICFRNIRANISFTGFCHLHSNCTSSQFPRSHDEEVVIVTKIDIDVKSDVDTTKCSTCNTPTSRITSVVEVGTSFEDYISLFAQQDQCIVVDFTESGEAIQSWISNVTMSVQNVCFMPTLDESQQGVSSQSSTISLRLNTQNHDTGGYLRSIARYQQNSSYCFIGYFDMPPRAASSNENITILLTPCASEKHPTTSSTHFVTPEPPHEDDMTTTIAISTVVTVAVVTIIGALTIIIIICCIKKMCHREQNLNFPAEINWPEINPAELASTITMEIQTYAETPV